MYKTFKKILKNDLKIYLKEKGFIHYKDETFIGFYNDLFFMLSFDKGSYGTILEFSFELGVPIVKQDFLTIKGDLDRWPVRGYSLSSAKWELERYNAYDLKVKKEKIYEYIKEIKYVYKNYIFYYISKVINIGIEPFINQEYNNLFDDYLEKKGEEDPAWVYQMEFLLSGKTQDEWTQEDSDKCEQLVKEKQDAEFPYEKIRKQILKTIEKNRPIYEEIKQELFGSNTNEVKYDRNIFPVILEELFDDGHIELTLNDLGFFRQYDVNTQGRMIYGETYYFYNGDSELQVILKEELFLEFILSTNNETYRVNRYDGKYFWFGWLVGERSSMKANISIALDKLKEVLENSIDY